MALTREAEPSPDPGRRQRASIVNASAEGSTVVRELAFVQGERSAVSNEHGSARTTCGGHMPSADEHALHRHGGSQHVKDAILPIRHARYGGGRCVRRADDDALSNVQVARGVLVMIRAGDGEKCRFPKSR